MDITPNFNKLFNKIITEQTESNVWTKTDIRTYFFSIGQQEPVNFRKLCGNFLQKYAIPTEHFTYVQNNNDLTFKLNDAGLEMLKFQDKNAEWMFKPHYRYQFLNGRTDYKSYCASITHPKDYSTFTDISQFDDYLNKPVIGAIKAETNMPGDMKYKYFLIWNPSIPTEPRFEILQSLIYNDSVTAPARAKFDELSIAKYTKEKAQKEAADAAKKAELDKIIERDSWTSSLLQQTIDGFDSFDTTVQDMLLHDTYAVVTNDMPVKNTFKFTEEGAANFNKHSKFRVYPHIRWTIVNKIADFDNSFKHIKEGKTFIFAISYRTDLKNSTPDGQPMDNYLTFALADGPKNVFALSKH